jgi:DNA-binding GntR family transcriptional regulator
MDKKTPDKNAAATTISENIYRYLKDSIIKNIIKPNEKINEKEVATLFHSSKTPVREAIMKLSAVGFVESAPNKYAVVVPCTYKKFKELNEMMALLESHIFKLAIANIDEEAIRTIEEMTARMEKLCAVETINEYFDLNGRIHEIMYTAAENETASGLIRLVKDNHFRHMMFILESNHSLIGAHLKKSLKNHFKLNQALKTRNPALLTKVIKDHYSQYM